MSSAAEARVRHCHTASSQRGRFFKLSESSDPSPDGDLHNLFPSGDSDWSHLRDARTETPQSLNGSAAHPPRGRSARSALRSPPPGLQAPQAATLPTSPSAHSWTPDSSLSPATANGILPRYPAPRGRKVILSKVQSHPRARMFSLHARPRVPDRPFSPSLLPSLPPSEALNRCRQA